MHIPKHIHINHSCFQTCTGTLNFFRHYLNGPHVRIQMSVSSEITWISSCKLPSITILWCLHYTMFKYSRSFSGGFPQSKSAFPFSWSSQHRLLGTFTILSVVLLCFSSSGNQGYIHSTSFPVMQVAPIWCAVNETLWFFQCTFWVTSCLLHILPRDHPSLKKNYFHKLEHVSHGQPPVC